MNYIKQINAFWELERERGDFTAHLQSFYFALLYFANKFDKAEFSLYREDVIEQAKLGKDTYYKVRKHAQEAGLIEVEEGASKRSKCLFRVCLLYDKKDNTQTSDRTTRRHQVGQQVGPYTTNLQTNKPTNLQTDKPQKEIAPPAGDVFSEASDLKWDQAYLPTQPEEEKEKDSAQKEKEVSQRQWEKRYMDTWWEFYQNQNEGKEPPHSWRNNGLWGGLKKIQQDLAAEFEGSEERAYQEFVHILSGWQHPKNYHRHRIRPDAMHRHLVEIRGILRESLQKVKENIENITCVQEALEVYRQAHLEHKDIPASPHPKETEHVYQTLEYLRSTTEGGTWEGALKAFEFICQGWPVLEAHDKFYRENFTIRFIHGNTSKIIGIFKSKRHKQAELTVDSAAAWLERNGLGQ